MIFSRAGFGALKFAYIVVLAGLAVGVFLVGGSYLYWQDQKKSDLLSQRSLQDLRGRLATAQRDREDLRGSESTYESLSERGMFMAEERFDLIEALAALKSRHQLLSLTYEVAPQRPLRLSSGATYAGVTLAASRVKLKIRTLHDADLLAFLDEFPRMQRGFFPLDRCAIKRGADPFATAAGTAPLEEGRPGATPASDTAAVTVPTGALEAECSLEWITLQTKGANAAAAAVPSSTQGGRPL